MAETIKPKNAYRIIEGSYFKEELSQQLRDKSYADKPMLYPDMPAGIEVKNAAGQVIGHFSGVKSKESNGAPLRLTHLQMLPSAQDKEPPVMNVPPFKVEFKGGQVTPESAVELEIQFNKGALMQVARVQALKEEAAAKAARDVENAKRPKETADGIPIAYVEEMGQQKPGAPRAKPIAPARR